MKKYFLILFSILVFILPLVYLKIKYPKIKKIEGNSKTFTESGFYKTYYSSNDLILVNVWATWCESCLKEFPALEKVIPNDKLKFVSISIDDDTLRLKKYLNKNPIVKSRDITLQNLFFRDTICRRIELTDYTSAIEVYVGAKTIPYTVLIKNKKILYKAIDDLDIDSLNTIIKKNSN